MKQKVTATILLFILSVMAFAHGKEKHVMGTVTNVSENSITVETTSNKSVTVEVNDKTRFQKSGSAATLKDLKVGDIVVVHANVSKNKLVANEVRFGAKKNASLEGIEGTDHK